MNGIRASRQTGPRTLRRGRALLLAVLLLLLAPVLCAGEENGGAAKPGDAPQAETPRQQLIRATTRETVLGDPESALGIYETLVRSEGFSGLAPDIKRDALLGAARCHALAHRDDDAARYWGLIQDDATLPDEARTWASAQLRKYDEARRPVGVSAAETDQRLLAKLRAERAARDMRKAQEYVEEAHTMLATGRFDAASRLCFLALSLDETNQEANTLKQQIESRRPDLGALLSHLIRFFQTQELTEFERLSNRVGALEQLGTAAFNNRDWQAADTHLRKAIRLLDESNFLTLGGTHDTSSLDAVRSRLVVWLRQAGEHAGEIGLELPPLPPLPDVSARRGGLQQQFFGIMARVFNQHEKRDAPLHFYKFAPHYKQGADAKRELDRPFFNDLMATHVRGTITRAHWAEDWIRTNIGASWADPRGRAPRRRGQVGRRRLLIRLGDLICAQSRPGEDARIEKLRRSFANTPPPLSVDVHVFAANGGGAVRATEALRIRVGPRDHGTVHVITGGLVSEFAVRLNGLEGVKQLGSARISLDGETSTLMELTRYTPEHPTYAKLPPPALSVPDVDARYGLWLDLYSEDMPHGTGSAADRSAIGVVARVTHPHERVGSHVIPRSSGAEQPHTRLPLLVSIERKANRIVPHYGALLVQGLPNPFPATNAEFGELILLIGTTRQDTPIPDPPRHQPSHRIVPADTRTRDYRLGSLSINVEDDIVRDGWPQRHAATEGTSSAFRAQQRNTTIADILMPMANLDPEAPGGREALQVQDHRAVATLTAAEHLRLDRAIVRFRAHENDLYQATILAAVVDRAQWAKWTELPGLKRNTSANFTASGEGRRVIEQELTALSQRPGLFNTGDVLLLRATQQRIHMNLYTRSITKDLRVRLLPRGLQRYTTEPGVAEEGLIVQVRPGLEVDEGGGLRIVRVRARAARLDRIDVRAYPGATQEAAVYDVPQWHSGTNGAVSDRAEAEIVGDKDALLLPLSMPGTDDQVILVYIRTVKVQ